MPGTVEQKLEILPVIDNAAHQKPIGVSRRFISFITWNVLNWYVYLQTNVFITATHFIGRLYILIS